MTTQERETLAFGELVPEDLGDRAQLALLHRILHRAGYTDGVGAGHISMRLDDGTILITARNFGWDEMRASYLMRIDADGEVVDGDYVVGDAARTLHSVIHSMRPEIKIAVHNHSVWGTVWAAAGRIPPIYDQFSSLAHDDLVLSGEYRDDVAHREEAIADVAAMNGSTKTLLRNHGVLVLAQTIRQAHLRCTALEYRCRLAWHVEALGGGQPMAQDVAAMLAERMDTPKGIRFHLEYAMRRELGESPQVLE